MTFSKAEVPLVHEVLPAFLTMKARLEDVCNSIDPSPTIRIGAQAALNVFDKYMRAIGECNIYFISIGKSTVCHVQIYLSRLTFYFGSYVPKLQTRVGSATMVSAHQIFAILRHS